MKIKLSKTQWEEMGKKAGWMKQAQEQEMSDADLHQECIVAFKDLIKDMYPGDMSLKLPKIDWLMSQLQRKIDKNNDGLTHGPEADFRYPVGR